MQQLINQYIGGLKLGRKQTFKNLAVFALLSDYTADLNYLTLDEALAKDLIDVVEVSQGGSVPELKVVNNSDRMVLILDGEELVGAKQNRIVNTTILIAGSGFADSWNRNFFTLFDPGYTCCLLNDMSNRRSLLDERIDIIFVRNAPFRAWAFVMGRVPIFPLFWPPNWASDHAGVFAQLIFR